ncbi:MAG: ABC transporter permease [Ruminococcus sp.]|nr:ABC transporter permease [Ruminococcus sp.]MBQ9957311.1 ABC transporter permease [Ruminococcus sp.]
MNTLKEIYNYRQMVFSLVRKDLRGRYKGSVLGFLWTFINPLFQLIVYTIAFSFILPSSIDKYYLHLFVALIPWIFFSSSIQGGASSIISAKDMVSKIYFPREVIPISYVTSCFVNMLLSFIIIFAVVIFSGVGVNPLALLCLPVVMIIEYVMALGLALLFSAITVYFRDLEHILGIITMAWIYLTPVLYPIDMIADETIKKLFYINPMTSVIVAYRDILYYAKVPDFSTLMIALAFGVVILVAGFAVFSKLKKHFAEEL